MKKNLIKVLITIGLVLVLTISAFAILGVFNLSGYNSTTVNNAMAGKSLSEIYSYMASNFTWSAHNPAWSPEQLLANKWGDCNDFMTYGIYCGHKVCGLPENAFLQVWIHSTDGSDHAIAIYKNIVGYGSNFGLHYYIGNTKACCEHWCSGSGRTPAAAHVWTYDCRYLGMITW